MFALNELVVDTVKGGIGFLYKEKDIERFYVLETVARVPYFAFVSVLHLRQTLGDRSGAERLVLHYAQSDNELHHLLIMESLGGNASAVDRGFAQSVAVAFYWYAVGVYAFAPKMAYHLSELIESHAYVTYDTFLRDNKEALQKKPAPDVANEYYCDQNNFLHDVCLNAAGEKKLNLFGLRPPKLRSLYDVFRNVRDDEYAHKSSLSSLVNNRDYLKQQK